MPYSLKATFSGLTALSVSLTTAYAQEQTYLDRPAEDEFVYFVLPDRFENGDTSNDTGGFPGGRLDHGFDPTHKGFYNGGDLRGLINRLDYLQGMGVTAIWLGPIFKNRPVQGGPGQESAGYHGYWITDFTDVDPHFGTKEELHELIREAHARDMKVYQDIITNHTADVISYHECHDPDYRGKDKPVEGCPYRSKANYPYWTRGDAKGRSINKGFKGETIMTVENFAKLTRPDYAYTPYVPEGMEDLKVPAWLNEVQFYHNRGETRFNGENSLYGDFAGLDDLFTEHPRVVEGFIEIYGDWISEFKVDGFRIDTARHVNPEFWRAFLPAMQERAEAEGIPHFYIFGEVYDPSPVGLAPFTRTDKFPTVLDFGFQNAATQVIANGEPTDMLRAFFKADVLYEDGFETARKLPTFLGNHDMGRFALFVRRGNPDAEDKEVLARTILGHAFMTAARGVPVIYSGDEQGFAGDGHDQDARENMFPSQVAVYNDNDLVGTDATTAAENFAMDHPIYEAIASLSAIRAQEPTLRYGEQIVRHTETDGGVFALSRIDEENGTEILFVMNADNQPRTLQVEVDHRSSRWSGLAGDCARKSTSKGSVKVELGATSYAMCKSNW